MAGALGAGARRAAMNRRTPNRVREGAILERGDLSPLSALPNAEATTFNVPMRRNIGASRVSFCGHFPILPK